MKNNLRPDTGDIFGEHTHKLRRTQREILTEVQRSDSAWDDAPIGPVTVATTIATMEKLIVTGKVK